MLQKIQNNNTLNEERALKLLQGRTDRLKHLNQRWRRTLWYTYGRMRGNSLRLLTLILREIFLITPHGASTAAAPADKHNEFGCVR